MGKFNYMNRKSEGLKLGQIVAKDLRKRATVHPPKASEPFSLELNLQGKSLTDEGLIEVALALQEILALQPNNSPLSELDDLNLSGNGLTWKSLPHIARVVQLAARTLRELNLSENKIQVREICESEAWEDFLDSFRECHLLSNLDLGSNLLMGPSPFEVLARVFVKHARLDAALGTASSAVETNDFLLASMLESRENERTGLRDPRMDETQNSVSPSVAENDKCEDNDKSNPKMKRLGLCSVPSIIFSDCSMSYPGALFLSSACFQYRPLKHLKSHRRRSSSTTNSAAAQIDSSYAEYRGLVYLPNHTLPPIGRDLLESAFTVSREHFLGEHSLSNENVAQNENIVENTDHMRFRSYGGIRKFTRSTLSTAIDNSEDLPEFKASARIRLESFRKKAERSTIEELGPNSIQLWSSALKALSYVRSLCTFDSGQKMEAMQAIRGFSSLSGATLINHEYDDDAVIESLSTSRPPKMLNLTLGKSSTPSPSLSGAPATASLTINFPKRQTFKAAATTQSLLPPSLHSHSSRSLNRNNVEMAMVSSVLDSATVGTSFIPSTLVSQNNHDQQRQCHHYASKQDGFYPWQTFLPGQGQHHLPQHIWRRIVAFAIGGPENTLSEQQMNKIFAWAVDRNTLGIERDRLGKSESAQIWMVLDGMGCLSYEV